MTDIRSAFCPICGGATHHVLARELRRGIGMVFHCPPCDLGFLVAEKQLDDYYARDYRQHASHKASGEATNPEEIFENYSQYQSDRIKLALEYLPKIGTDTSILELGASAGQFLRRWDAVGVRRCAIELDPACCEFMKRMDIETDNKVLQHSKFAQDKFDMVFAFQVMEHVESPVDFLREIKKVLTPNGVAIIEVPNLWDALRYVWGIAEYDRFYFHGDHLFYFTARALRIVARMAGFDNSEIRFSQDYSLLNHLNWIMNKVPQEDCHIGLGPVKVHGTNKVLDEWLSAELARLNAEYVVNFTSMGVTSNITLILRV